MADIVRFAIRNRYIRFCEHLDKNGFTPHQVWIATEAVIECTPGKKDVVKEVLEETWKNRY